MKSFVLVCAIAAVSRAYYVPAPLNKDGTVADVHEVKEAKLHHYAELAKAGGAVPHVHHSSHYSPPVEHHHDDHKYHGPPAPLKHDGTVDETHEVKHLKHKHLADVAEAFAKAPKGGPEINDDHHVPVHHEVKHEPEHHEHKYHGPPAPLNHDGTVDETDEVKHVKAERLAALHDAFSKASHGYHIKKRSADYGKWHGPPAPLKHDGTVDETHEVKYLKHKHLAEVAEAFAKAPKGGPQINDDHHVPVYHEVKHAPVHHEPAHKYHGPPAPLNHDGTVAETDEVKHVKAARLAALHEAFANHGYHIKKRSVDYGHWHGPPAPLKHDGTVDETHEVKYLKHKHLAEVAEAFAKAPKGGPQINDDHHVPVYHEVKHAPVHHEPAHKYHGPPAPLNHDGTVAETDEVKHVKAERLAALYEAFSKAPQDHGYHIRKRSADYGYYHGPPAPLNHDGTVDDTHEVKALQAEHFAAHAKAFHGYYPEANYDEEENIIEEHHDDHKYHGPPAPLNHDGTVDDTHEVKYLKAKHLAEVAEAYAKASKGGPELNDDYHEPIYHHEPQPAPVYHHEPAHKYHGPPAPLNHDGTVAETDEVKHVKAERLAALYDAFAKAPKGHEEPYKHSLEGFGDY